MSEKLIELKKKGGGGSSQLTKTLIGTYSSNTSVTMASLGYSDAEYTGWTIDNFSYTVALVDSYNFHTQGAGRRGCEYSPPSLSYDATTGTLSITAPMQRTVDYSSGSYYWYATIYGSVSVYLTK